MTDAHVIGADCGTPAGRAAAPEVGIEVHA